MNPFYYITIFLSVLLAISYCIVLIRKPDFVSKISKRFIIILSSGLILSIVTACIWSECLMSREIKKLNMLKESISSRSIDAACLTHENKTSMLDSIDYESRELEGILNSVRHQSVIIGGGNKTIDEINDARREARSQYNEIIKFNTVLNPDDIVHTKGSYSINSGASSFSFLPPQDLTGDYLDMGLYFPDESILPEIGYILVDIERKNADGSNEEIEHLYYEPKTGLNNFKLKNYFKDPRVYARIGFFWKKDLKNSEHPVFESIEYFPHRD